MSASTDTCSRCGGHLDAAVQIGKDEFLCQACALLAWFDRLLRARLGEDSPALAVIQEHYDDEMISRLLAAEMKNDRREGLLPPDAVLTPIGERVIARMILDKSGKPMWLDEGAG